MMAEAFLARGLLAESDLVDLQKPDHVFSRLALDVFHDVDELSGSRAEAYRFLDDNRRRLLIPRNADLVVSDLYTAQKLTRQARRLPKQIVLEYIWREDVMLSGAQFGRFDGQASSLLCGGTLALDQNGNVMTWRRKPGTQFKGLGQKKGDEEIEAAEGHKRLNAFRDAIARRVQVGRIGDAPGSAKGLLGKRFPPLTSRVVDGAVRFELSPHFGIHDDKDDELGSREWQISS
jgi:hypothetical protein